VAVALRRDQETSDALVAAGRLHLVATYDSRPVPDLGGHSGRTPADLPTLSRLADGTLAPQRTVGLRRHLPACVGCEETVEALAKGRRLAAGLPVIAMPDEEREAMLERVIARANATLPSVDDVLVAIEEDDDVQPAVSPLLVVAAIVFALILGVAVAAITRSSTGNATDEQLQTAPSATPVSPAFSVSASPSTSVSTTPTKSASATRSPTAPPSSSAPAVVINPAINIDPSSGPRGTAITVQGTGWEPSDTINIRYTGPVSTANQVATASRRGTFTVTLTANGLVPGDYTISASGGSGSASASFRQTS
jgi:anti-sigma factor RsiW